MRSRTIGRALGIGVRVAGRIAGQRLAAQTSPSAGGIQPQPVNVPAMHASAGANGASRRAQTIGQVTGRTAVRAGSGLGKGLGGFFRPFRRVGGILWLEVTGVFFLLPVIVFAPTLWRDALAYSHTTDHRQFWITAFVVAVFLYLGVSSFWRARRR